MLLFQLINSYIYTSQLKYVFRLEENVPRAVGQNSLNAFINSLGKQLLELSTRTWSGRALETTANLLASQRKATGSPNTLSAIKINVLLFTCVLVSFLSRLEGIWMKRRRFRVTSLRGEKRNYNSCTNLLLRKYQNLLFWLLKSSGHWKFTVFVRFTFSLNVSNHAHIWYVTWPQ